MTDTRVALGSDRLPWLQDLPERRRGGSVRQTLTWGAASVLLVAGASYWLGTQSRVDEPELPAPPSHQRTITTQLPEPQVRPPEPLEVAPVSEAELVPAPQPRPIPAPAVRSAPQRREAAQLPQKAAKKAVASEEQAASSTSKADTTARTAEPVVVQTGPPRLAPASALRLWPSRTTAGAHGRLVQIGAFGSRHQAKLGWRHMARAYPGVKRLPAVVVEARNSKGRNFYRFQIGTTSQAHSEVLCQRMQKINFSCAVMDLPWKPKGVER